MSGRAALAISLTVALSVPGLAADAEIITATAYVAHGGSKMTAPVIVTVSRWATDAERAAATTALKEGGTQKLQGLLASAQDAGTITVGQRQTPIKFAGTRKTGDGRLITIVTAKPIAYLGAGVPEAKAETGYDVAVAIFEVKDGGGGLGELSPAAKVGLDGNGAVTVQDYGSTVVWLNDIKAKSK